MDMTAKLARQARRENQALEMRRRALSPVRILLRLSMIPVIAVTVTLSIYIRTSDHAPGDALRHLVAMAGCEAAAAMKLAPARQGRLGYHGRNDSDGDGVACNEGHGMPPQVGPRPATSVASIPETAPAPAAEPAPGPRTEEPVTRMVGGAKFIRP